MKKQLVGLVLVTSSHINKLKVYNKYMKNEKNYFVTSYFFSENSKYDYYL